MGHDCCGQKRSLILFFSIIQQMQRLNLEYYVFGIKNNKCFKKKRNHQKRTEKIRKKQRYYYIKKRRRKTCFIFHSISILSYEGGAEAASRGSFLTGDRWPRLLDSFRIQSSMVSGKGLPPVSGSIRDNTADSRALDPNKMVGI